MASKSMSKNNPVGVIGAGSFGAAIANILAENSEVILYTRRQEIADEIRNNGTSHGRIIDNKIVPTTDLEMLAGNCEVIFPIVPSNHFREMMKNLSPFLNPYHILIHGTKGVDFNVPNDEIYDPKTLIDRSCIHTMSEIIREESVVLRIGCLAGPNLAKELVDKHPAATVVASHFDEVIQTGQKLLRTDRFQVYGSKDLTGVELAGVLKNIIAIASGAITGMGLGENARALLVSRGMVEMIYIGRLLGGNVEAFIGLAGIGDLVATCTSSLSRNYTVGYRLAKGETLDQILSTMEEVAEGVNTIKIIKKIVEAYKMRVPITEILHRVLFEGLTVEEALNFLMKYPFNIDVNFL